MTETSDGATPPPTLPARPGVLGTATRYLRGSVRVLGSVPGVRHLRGYARVLWASPAVRRLREYAWALWTSPAVRYLRGYGRRVLGGDLGALPAVGGLLVLCAVFTIASPVFATPGNFANLFTQGAGVAIIAMGLVYVLLLGDIDLSAGVTSGVAGAVLAELLTIHGYPLAVALPAAVVTGTVIGLVLGFLVAKVGVPSFVVTLAAFLAFQGVVLVVIGEGGNVSIRDDLVLAIENRNLPAWLGWLIYAVVVVGYTAVAFGRVLKRRRAGVVHEPLAVVGAKVAALVVLAGVAVYVLNLERSRNPLVVSLRGVPIVVALILALFVVLHLTLSRTAYGRHVYATGGNAEAARRAGISVDRIRISAFVVCSTMAAIGGIVLASRTNGVDPNAGGGNLLLYAVGAAVIGGTSLFGGQGRVADALVGAAVVAVIDNGMGLFGYSAGVKYVVTGAVLLVAAGVDALSRRRARARGVR